MLFRSLIVFYRLEAENRMHVCPAPRLNAFTRGNGFLPRLMNQVLRQFCFERRIGSISKGCQPNNSKDYCFFHTARLRWNTNAKNINSRPIIIHRDELVAVCGAFTFLITALLTSCSSPGLDGLVSTATSEVNLETR